MPGSLTNAFYSLIPTVTGRKAPPQINGMAILGEKEAQLEFWRAALPPRTAPAPGGLASPSDAPRVHGVAGCAWALRT